MGDRLTDIGYATHTKPGSAKFVLLMSLFIAGGPALLFFGHVESYTLLYSALILFYVSILLVLENKAPLQLASFFWGLAFFWHLSAVFSLPALLLVARYSPGSAARRILAAAGPAMLPVALSVGLHVWLGYDWHWFSGNFITNPHLSSFARPISGQTGILSVGAVCSTANLLIFLVPTALIVLAFGARGLFADRSPTSRVLLLQSIVFVAVLLIIDPKLGAARDWDFLAAHSVVMIVLSVSILPGRARVFRRRDFNVSAQYVLSSMFLLAPYIAVQASADGSVDRMSSIASTFTPSASSHAYEDLGRYYRYRGDLAAALSMYENARNADPDNPRYYTLVGGMCVALSREAGEEEERTELIDRAVVEYLRAIERNPHLGNARGNLGRLYVQEKMYEEAIPHLQFVKETGEADAITLAALGLAQLRTNMCERSIASFGAALAHDSNLRVRRYFGHALLCAGRFEESAGEMYRAVNSQENAAYSVRVYVMCLREWAAAMSAGTSLTASDTALPGHREFLIEWLDGNKWNSPEYEEYYAELSMLFVESMNRGDSVAVDRMKR